MKLDAYIQFNDNAKLPELAGRKIDLTLDLDYIEDERDFYDTVANELYEYVGYVPSRDEFEVLNYDEWEDAFNIPSFTNQYCEDMADEARMGYPQW